MPQEPPDRCSKFIELKWDLFHCRCVHVQDIVIPFDCVDDFKNGEMIHQNYEMVLFIMSN